MIIAMETPLQELGLRVIILAGRRGSSRYHKGVFPGADMLRLRQWQLLAVPLLVCLTPLGCGSSGHTAAGYTVDGGSATTGGGGTRGAPGSNGSTAPALPTPSTATESTAPASATPSTLPTYNPSAVSTTTKPTQPASGSISLGNIGSPTLDSQHPNGSTGHMIPAGISPHCILIYNQILPQAVTIVSVSFQVDLAGSGDAGPLRFDDHNTEKNCGWLHTPPAYLSLRAPTCGGRTLPPLTGDPFAGPSCVLRLDFPAPDSNVDRTGHFTFILQTQCVDRSVAPCNLLTEQPTTAHPVTVQWSPSPFYVAACGGDAPMETDADAAQGKCLDVSPSASASPSSTVASSSATPSPSS